jgi:hypothetical protein
MLGKRLLVILCYSLFNQRLCCVVVVVVVVVVDRTVPTYISHNNTDSTSSFFFRCNVVYCMVMSGRAEKTRAARVGSTKLGPNYICYRKRW